MLHSWIDGVRHQIPLDELVSKIPASGKPSMKLIVWHTSTEIVSLHETQGDSV